MEKYYRMVINLYKEVLLINRVNPDRVLDAQREISNAITTAMDMGKIGIVTPMSKALVETVKRATDGEFPTDSINSKLEQIKAMFENKGINPYDTLAWEISHRYRAKNSYGGYAITNCTYHFNKDISDIISVETK